MVCVLLLGTRISALKNEKIVGDGNGERIGRGLLVYINMCIILDLAEELT